MEHVCFSTSTHLLICGLWGSLILGSCQHFSTFKGNFKGRIKNEFRKKGQEIKFKFVQMRECEPESL